MIADRRNRRLAARSPADTAIAHQTRHALAADANAFVNELCVYSRTTIRRPRATRDRFNPVAEQYVALRMFRGRSLHPCVKTACRNLQYAAHRVDQIRGLVRLHESEDRFGSILSRANQVVAFERISRSISSCLRRLRSRAISWRSSVVRPSLRSPASSCAQRTQLRIVCPDGSNSSANSSGDRPARTSATSFVLNSGGYASRWRCGMVDFHRPHRASVHGTGSRSLSHSRNRARGISPQIEMSSRPRFE